MVTRSPRAAPDFQRLNQQPAPGLVGEAASQRAWEGQGYRPWEAATKADLENLLANPQHTMWVGEADITADITSVEVPVWKIPEAYEITLLGTVAGTGFYNPLGVNTPVLIIPRTALTSITAPRTLNFVVLLCAVNVTGVAPVPAGLLTEYSYTDFENVLVGDYDIAVPPKIRFGIELKANQT